MLKGWKTYLASFVVAGIGALEALNWVAIIPQNKFWSGLAMVGLGTAFAYLRKITTGPAAL